jgi:hypothetical protein
MKKHQGVILGIAALALVFALSGANVPSPPEWLVSWTAWVSMVAAFYFGPSVLLKLLARG